MQFGVRPRVRVVVRVRVTVRVNTTQNPNSNPNPLNKIVLSGRMWRFDE